MGNDVDRAVPSKALLACTVWVDDGPVSLTTALETMTDHWIESDQYCEQTVFDLRDALRESVRAFGPVPALVGNSFDRRGRVMPERGGFTLHWRRCEVDNPRYPFVNSRPVMVYKTLTAARDALRRRCPNVVLTGVDEGGVK